MSVQFTALTNHEPGMVWFHIFARDRRHINVGTSIRYSNEVYRYINVATSIRYVCTSMRYRYTSMLGHPVGTHNKVVNINELR